MTPPAAVAAPQQQVIQAQPFTASAHEHVEPAFTFTTTPGAAVQQLNPQDIPAYGYIRHIFLEIAATGGAGGTGNADYPFNILSSVTLQDVNGANIVGPIDGYALYLANVFGGYGFADNPAAAGQWSVLSAPNPTFYLRVPVEISAHDGLGALANQNAAANYKLSLAVNTIAATMSTVYTTAPTITIRGWLEAWTLPALTDSKGRPQSQVPPLLGTGQYWSSATRGTIAGSNTIGLTRVGNLIRNLLFIARDNTGARADSAFPDPMQFNWDGIQVLQASQKYLAAVNIGEKTLGFTRPAGVFLLPYSHGGLATGKIGNESPDLWLPTSQSSRLEVVGSASVAGTVQVVTNEVAPVEMNQAERFQVPSDSGSLASA